MESQNNSISLLTVLYHCLQSFIGIRLKDILINSCVKLILIVKMRIDSSLQVCLFQSHALSLLPLTSLIYNSLITILDSIGQPFSSNEMKNMLQEALTLIFEGNRSSFRPNVFSTELIRQHYQVFRSFRCSSDTRAIEFSYDFLLISSYISFLF